MKYPHWQYFVALCHDLERVARYVEISKDNFSVYSIELARLYLAAGSEIDVVAKLLCQQVDSSAKLEGINTYRTTILKKYPNMPSVEVILPRYEISFYPRQDWSKGSNPSWWKAYNNVKHERDKHYKAANLENTLSAIAGLLTFIGYLHSKELLGYQLMPQPEFMRFSSKYCKSAATKMNLSFLLPDITKP
jgi:hypothetical protein